MIGTGHQPDLAVEMEIIFGTKTFPMGNKTKHTEVMNTASALLGSFSIISVNPQAPLLRAWERFFEVRSEKCWKRRIV